MSVASRLKEEMSNGNHMLKTQSSLSNSEIKALALLDIIEIHKHKLKSGKLPTHPNCFSVTVNGRKFIEDMASNDVPLVQVVRKVGSVLDETNEKFEDLEKQFNEIRDTLDGVHHLLGMMTEIHSVAQPRLGEDHKLLYMSTAESMAAPQMRMGVYTAIESYFLIMEKMGMREEEIVEYLRTLHQKGKLELANGVSTKSIPKGARFLETDDGMRFMWGRLVHE